jgi:hypothetical protein
LDFKLKLLIFGHLYIFPNCFHNAPGIHFPPPPNIVDADIEVDVAFELVLADFVEHLEGKMRPKMRQLMKKPMRRKKPIGVEATQNRYYSFEKFN